MDKQSILQNEGEQAQTGKKGNLFLINSVNNTSGAPSLKQLNNNNSFKTSGEEQFFNPSQTLGSDVAGNNSVGQNIGTRNNNNLNGSQPVDQNPNAGIVTPNATIKYKLNKESRQAHPNSGFNNNQNNFGLGPPLNFNQRGISLPTESFSYGRGGTNGPQQQQQQPQTPLNSAPNNYNVDSSGIDLIQQQSTQTQNIANNNTLMLSNSIQQPPSQYIQLKDFKQKGVSPKNNSFDVKYIQAKQRADQIIRTKNCFDLNMPKHETKLRRMQIIDSKIEQRQNQQVIQRRVVAGAGGGMLPSAHQLSNLQSGTPSPYHQHLLNSKNSGPIMVSGLKTGVGASAIGSSIIMNNNQGQNYNQTMPSKLNFNSELHPPYIMAQSVKSGMVQKQNPILNPITGNISTNIHQPQQNGPQPLYYSDYEMTGVQNFNQQSLFQQQSNLSYVSMQNNHGNLQYLNNQWQIAPSMGSAGATGISNSLNKPGSMTQQPFNNQSQTLIPNNFQNSNSVQSNNQIMIINGKGAGIEGSIANGMHGSLANFKNPNQGVVLSAGAHNQNQIGAQNNSNSDFNRRTSTIMAKENTELINSYDKQNIYNDNQQYRQTPLPQQQNSHFNNPAPNSSEYYNNLHQHNYLMNHHNKGQYYNNLNQNSLKTPQPANSTPQPLVASGYNMVHAYDQNFTVPQIYQQIQLQQSFPGNHIQIQQHHSPLQISQSLFVMDCQTFGIFNNQNLLKINNQNNAGKNAETQQQTFGINQGNMATGGLPSLAQGQNQFGNTNDPFQNQNQQPQLSESQLVSFVMNRALSNQTQPNPSTIISKDLPKLSDDARKILSIVRTQKQIQLQQQQILQNGIPLQGDQENQNNQLHKCLKDTEKIDSLVIELDYYDYKNQLLQQLFHHYGNRVLSNLVHKIYNNPSDIANNSNVQSLNQQNDFLKIEDSDQKKRNAQDNEDYNQQQSSNLQKPDEEIGSGSKVVIMQNNNGGPKNIISKQGAKETEANNEQNKLDTNHFQTIEQYLERVSQRLHSKIQQEQTILMSNQLQLNQKNSLYGARIKNLNEGYSGEIPSNLASQNQASISKNQQSLKDGGSENPRISGLNQNNFLLNQLQSTPQKANYNLNDMNKSEFQNDEFLRSSFENFEGENKLLAFKEEIQHIFPKYVTKKVKGFNEIDLDHSFTNNGNLFASVGQSILSGPDGQPLQDLQNSNNKINSIQKQKQSLQNQNMINQLQNSKGKPGDKKVKKLNFHVIVKNTKLYHALTFIERYRRDQNVKIFSANSNQGREYLDEAEESLIEGRISRGKNDQITPQRNEDRTTERGSSNVQYRASLKNKEQMNEGEISSFIITKDCSILKFALYCFHVGIVNSVQQMLRQFFKHVFIVIKPGQRVQPDGSVMILKELPQVDVDKISKYLIQTKLRKAMQQQALKNGGKINGKMIQDAEGNMIDGTVGNINDNLKNGMQGKKGIYGNVANYGQIVGSGYSYSGKNNKQNQRYDGGPGGKFSLDRGENLKRNFSLNSYKSMIDINKSEELFLQEYQNHFNSGPSTIKVEGPAVTEPTLIKIIHKPYTHLDNSRTQKCFKIYNEFVQLVFKNRMQIVHNSEHSSGQGYEFSKTDLNRIYKLAQHMNVKLPKRSILTAVGRQPLIDALKNHRSLQIIKEQMIRFAHRIINEENCITPNFFNSVIIGTQISNQYQNMNTLPNQNGSPNKAAQQTGNSQMNQAQGANAASANNNGTGQKAGRDQVQGNDLQMQNSSNANQEQNVKSKESTKKEAAKDSIMKIVCQQTMFFKYQVGFGNNHLLIKALMKQRLWLHLAQREKQNVQTGIVRLDFDDANIMWTQWRKVRLYDHMITKAEFDQEFGPLIKAINQQKFDVIINNTLQNYCSPQQYNQQDKNQDSANNQAAMTVYSATSTTNTTSHNNNTGSSAQRMNATSALAISNYQQAHQSINDQKQNEEKEIENESIDTLSHQKKLRAGKLSKVGQSSNNEQSFLKKNSNPPSPIQKSNGLVKAFKNGEAGDLTEGGLRNGITMMTDEQYSDDFDNNNSTTGEKIGNHKFNENSRISKLEKGKLPNLINQQKDNVSHPQKASINSTNNQIGSFPSEISQKHKNQQQNSFSNIQEIRTALERCKKKFQKIYNRLEFNQHLNNKKALFFNMRNYYTHCCEKEDVFNTLPLTFHIKNGSNDQEYLRFEEYYMREQQLCQSSLGKNRKNIWIIKPGENSNRGNGIKVEQELSKIRGFVHSYCSGNRTMILQKYIDNPLLYQRRKFDIRCFSLVTSVNGIIKAYFYRDGYIRTSSKEYTATNLYNKYVHLVNDAVQKYSEDYGKYEPGNKLSYCELQKFFTTQYPEKKINLERDILMQVKKIVTDTIRATFHVLDSKKRLNSFELFGYDFMFDDQFKPYLIEVNSNPSLEPSSNLLQNLFQQMLNNTFRIAIDPLFPPYEGFSMKKGSIGVEICPENRFDLVFDERVDGEALLKKLSKIGKQEREELEGINELEGSEDEQDNDDII